MENYASLSILPCGSRFEVTVIAQFPVELFLPFGWVRRHNNLEPDVLIASSSAALIQSLASKPQPLAALRAGRYLDLSLSVDRRHLDGRSQNRLPGRDRKFSGEVIFRDGEDRMRRDLQPDI